MRKIFLAVVAITVALGLPISAAKAAGEKSGAFFRLQPGAILFNDIGFSAAASAYGVTVTASGNFTFDPGYGVTGALGYQFNEFVSIEGEVGYGVVEYNNVEGNLNATVGGTTYTVSGSADIDGEVEMLTGIANIILSPMGKEKFSPYVGGGIGVVDWEDKVNSVGTLTVNGKETGSDLMANGIVGFDYKMDDDIAIGARYRYLWADTGQSGLDDATAHSFMLSLKVSF